VLTVSGVLLAGRAWAPSPGRSVAASQPGAKVSAAPRPTPSDDMLARARAIVAPAAPPTRLLIPTIGVNTKVESVGLDAQGRMGTPSVPANVGWYSSGVAPGDAGDALIDGHLNWTSGPAVFWRLGQLRVGDPLTVVRADGTRVRFIVDSTSVVPYTASEDSLFTATGPPSISLITCAGAWDQQHATYLQRLLVHASLAPGNPIESPTAGGS
jgi:sortase (surface protein transpeptidase)